MPHRGILEEHEFKTPMPPPFRFLILLALGSVAPIAATDRARAGFDGPMTFYEAANGGNCVTCRWIAAEGVIEADTADRFVAFLDETGLRDARGLNVHLNSPGGDLFGGVRLGRAIRRQQANTVVATAPIETVYDDGLRKVGYDPTVAAECASACVFAFAGGVSRFASATTPGAAIGFQDVGRLGVHQFYDPRSLADPWAPTANAEDRIADQRIVAGLLGFLFEMDVSAEVLQLAARTGPRDMRYLDEDELRRTRIDNRMVRDVVLTGYRNGVAVVEVAYRRRDGDHRLELFCDGGAIHMLATIDWRGAYDVDGHRRWDLFDGVSLTDGGAVTLLSERFTRRPDGGVSGALRFRFNDPAAEIVGRTTFAFEDWSSRHANDAASSMSFRLPEGFEGLHLLPRTCM